MARCTDDFTLDLAPGVILFFPYCSGVLVMSQLFGRLDWKSSGSRKIKTETEAAGEMEGYVYSFLNIMAMWMLW